MTKDEMTKKEVWVVAKSGKMKLYRNLEDKRRNFCVDYLVNQQASRDEAAKLIRQHARALGANVVMWWQEASQEFIAEEI